MDWTNERYVRVYTRDTEDDLLLSWQASALWVAIMRKMDRAGVLEAKRGAASVALIVRWPVEVVAAALPELLADGRLVEHEVGFLAPNFLEAQEAPQSDKQRAAESRARRRERSRSVTNRDVTITIRDQNVTPGHTTSHDVTSCHSDQTLQSDPDQTNQGEPLAPPALALVPVEPKKRLPSGPHQEAIASFDSAYQDQNGARPTWNSTSAKIIGDLVKAHGAPEVQRRIEILFLGQGPPWLRPPFDVKTLSTHFDKLAKPHTPAPARSVAPANDERDRIRKIPDLGGRRP